MAKIFAVFKRELGLYFRSPVAYAVAFALLLFFGLWFSNRVDQVSQAQYPADFVNNVPSLLTFLMFLVAPLLTMRLLAEETREGTLETLMTLPIRESQFILGKFLAVWAYYTVLLAITVVYHIIVTQIGIPDLGRVFGLYLGAWLYGGAVLAVAMVWSAVTEDQIVAAFLGAATILMLVLVELAANWIASLPDQGTITWLVDFVREFSLSAHYDATLAVGVIRAEDILYFVFLMAAALFITTRIVEVRRWRS